jgi:indole-3-glycerol phosphate synthase
MILEEIAEKARRRVERAKAALPLEELRRRAAAAFEAARAAPRTPAFEAALAAPALSFICELKRASPSRGLITVDFPYRRIAAEYEAAGAAALSVLTEPDYFLGRDEYLQEIAAAAGIPVLRKDFVVDLYQIYEAQCLGAQAILLICALLDRETLGEYLAAAGRLGLSCLTEVHTADEAAMAVEAGARIIGINNRDLKTFRVDLAVTQRLRKLIPPDRLVVAESGVNSPEDVRFLQEQGIDGVLIGESLMRAPDKKQRLAELARGAFHSGSLCAPPARELKAGGTFR